MEPSDAAPTAAMPRSLRDTPPPPPPPARRRRRRLVTVLGWGRKLGSSSSSHHRSTTAVWHCGTGAGQGWQASAATFPFSIEPQHDGRRSLCRLSVWTGRAPRPHRKGRAHTRLEAEDEDGQRHSQRRPVAAGVQRRCVHRRPRVSGGGQRARAAPHHRPHHKQDAPDLDGAHACTQQARAEGRRGWVGGALRAAQRPRPNQAPAALIIPAACRATVLPPSCPPT